jgi:hypothetical protein
LATTACFTWSPPLQADGSAARDAFQLPRRSLVFLIDWNKARKVLRQWVAGGDAVRVLEWAAQTAWAIVAS